jgi:phage tail sheath gpL-like
MTIPTNLRGPILAVEFDSSRAFQGPALLEYQALLVGGRTSSGTVDELDIKRVTSADQAGGYFGLGSELHRMAIKWFLNNKTTVVYMVALDDDAAGVAGTQTLTITGTASAAGAVLLYIGGTRLAVAVANLDDPTAIAASVAAAVTAATSLPVSAASALGVVTFTAKNDGEGANSIDIRLNYNEGDVLPASVSGVVAAGVTGANNPDVQDVLDILGDEWYNILAAPYTDATNMTAIEAELADRFGPLRMIDGVYCCAKDDSLSNLASFGNGRNSPHVCCPASTDVLENVYEAAAGMAGQLAAEGAADPARPFQTLQLQGFSPVPVVNRFTYLERNSLLYDGISTLNVTTAGTVRIERAISMYQKNAVDAADIAYLNINTLLTLMYIRFDFRNSIRTKYPRAKLANDGVRVAPGQVVMTPKVGKAEAIAKFRQWEDLGLVENFDQFKNDLVCVRSSVDPDRLEWTLPPDLINQFRIGAATIQFLLESPAS